MTDVICRRDTSLDCSTLASQLKRVALCEIFIWSRIKRRIEGVKTLCFGVSL